MISCQSKGLSRVFSNTSSKASILPCSAFFIVQFSHPYMTTGKTIALTIRTFVGKVMSLLFNMLSRLVIAFLLRSRCLLISWMQSPSAVILEPKKIKSLTVSIVSPSTCHEVMGPEARTLPQKKKGKRDVYLQFLFKKILNVKAEELIHKCQLYNLIIAVLYSVIATHTGGAPQLAKLFLPA